MYDSKEIKMKKAIKKLIRRKNKKYYEASDALTKKEKRQLWIAFSIIATPILVGLSIILVN